MEEIADIETKHLKLTRMDGKDVHKNWKLIQEIPTLPENVRNHPGTEREKLWNAIQWVDRQNEITQDSLKREVRRKEIEYQNDITKQLNRTIEDFRKMQDYEKQAILHNLIQTSTVNKDPEIRTQAEIKYNEFMRESLKNPKKTQETPIKMKKIETTKDLFEQIRKEDEQIKEITKERKQKEEEMKKTIDLDSDNESDLEDKDIQREHDRFMKNLNKSEGKQSNLGPEWQRFREANIGPNINKSNKKDSLKPLMINDEVTKYSHSKKSSISSMASTSSIPSIHLNNQPAIVPTDYEETYKIDNIGNLHKQGDIEIEDDNNIYNFNNDQQKYQENKQETLQGSQESTNIFSKGYNYIFRRKRSNNNLKKT